MCLWASYKKKNKNMKKIFFFASLKGPKHEIFESGFFT
jgi:hypothetical protein